jgi:hypothetical protein
VLRGGGARQWQIDLTAEMLVAALVAPVASAPSA